MRTPGLRALTTLPLALTALLAAPAHAGPVEDLMGPVRGVTDPWAECLHPSTGACTHPCGGAAECVALAEQAVALAQAEADALAAEAEGLACGPDECGGAIGQALADAEAAAGQLGAAVDEAVAAADPTDEVVAAEEDARGQALEAYLVAIGVYEDAKDLPGTVDATLPQHVRFRCEDVVRAAPYCAFWGNREPGHLGGLA